MRFVAGMLAGGVVVLAGLWLAAQKRGLAVEPLLGHLPYRVVDAARVVPVDDTGRVYMLPRAARAFKEMRAAARGDGVALVAVSGYRSVQKQKELFFDGAKQKALTLRQRAQVCAPPGYSEHHTGYSVDVGDGAHDETRLETEFRQTAGFRWLLKNAARFHFEMSFPADNTQGVAYEPWHWRYVGSMDSFKTFFQARRGTESMAVEASRLPFWP